MLTKGFIINIMDEQEIFATVGELEDLSPEAETVLEEVQEEFVEYDEETESFESAAEVDQESDFVEIVQNYALEDEPMVIAQVEVTDKSQMIVYQVRISGNTYYAYFPVDSQLAVLDGSLVNLGSSNVSGALSQTGRLEIDSYHQMMLTVQPLLTTGSQSNAYRYGSRSYITTYTPGLNSTLSSTNSYVSVSVLDSPSPGSGWNQWELGVFVLLFALVIFNMIGAFLRK